MPKVVVYVPAAAWRRLEERGLDPAATVREFARSGYEMTGPVLSEREPKENAAEPTSQSMTHRVSRSESTPKRRMYPCKHHVPPSKKCQYCDV